MFNIAAYDTVKTPVLCAAQNTVIWAICSLFYLNMLIQLIYREVVAIVANTCRVWNVNTSGTATCL